MKPDESVSSTVDVKGAAQDRKTLSTGTEAVAFLDRPLTQIAPLTKLAHWIGAQAGWQRLVIALVSGALAALSMAPFFAVPLLLISLTVLVWQIDGLGRWQRRLRMAGLLGWAYGTGFFAVGLHWIGNAFLVDAETFGALMPFAMILLAMGMGLFPAATVVIARRFWATGPSRIGVLALAWVGVEWLRSWVFTGFPWHLAGYSWGGLLAVSQSTALFGIFGLSLITVLAACGPAALTDNRDGTPGVGRTRSLIWCFAPVLALALLSLWGLWRLSDGGTAYTDTTLRIIQPSVPQADKLDAGNASPIYHKHMALTRQPKLEKADLVIWSEAAVPILTARNESILQDIGATLRDGQHLIMGSVRFEEIPGTGEGRFFNSLHAINSSGEIVATYDKAHLVPFGEYLPMQDLLEGMGLTKLVGGRGSYTPGPHLQTLHLRGVPEFGPLICYEAIFPAQVVDPVKRPRWLLNLTDDTWFGLNAGPKQHFTIARMRSIEEGLPLIRAANNGVSAIFDPKGRIVMSLGLNKVGYIDGELPQDLPPTLYARLGNLTLLFMALLLAGVIYYARLRTDTEAW